jgi:hypothetical protein
VRGLPDPSNAVDTHICSARLDDLDVVDATFVVTALSRDTAL